MDPTEQLLECYAEWRRFAEAEAAALRAADWLAVSHCQAAKARLEPRILEATRVVEKRCAARGPVARAAQEKIRVALASLIAIETANGNFLAAQRQNVQHCQAELRQIRENLSRVHRSYGSGATAHWQSYS